MRVRSPAFCRLPLGGIAASETHRARAIIVDMENCQRLTPEQQAQWVAKIREAEFHEPDLSSDLLGAGLWVACAALALVWFRSVAQRRTLGWLTTVGPRVVALIVARPIVPYLGNEQALESARSKIILQPVAART